MHLDLPPPLARRCAPDLPAPRAGEGVVVWLRMAVRGHENPALDVGRHLAQQLDLPLLVYHAVSERYPHASDRHHAFILQGARDLADELDGLGLRAAFHVERPGHRGPVLKQLAERAAVVVTDAVPLDPLRAWTRRLAAVAPVWEVDSACIAPVYSLPARPERAFRFRERTAPHQERFEWPWPTPELQVRPWTGPLPFAPVDPRAADLAALIGSCAIDHGVGPVPDTPGGSRAGYARWARFRDDHLARYARRRNDAALPDGVSRMSAYLHYGHVSPFRIAREAAERGASKYLDELLTWRELAWHFCHHTTDPRRVDALPAWARETLERHAADRRSLLPLEPLELARTGEPLWDAAQESLLRHGELHNNVRMTWGKAVLGWSRGPRQTLARLFELNDRYALDGRDPASVGGILWCLGALDRPFEPEQPVYGTVRPRDPRAHAARLDLETWSRHVRRPLGSRCPRVLIVGAGIAGAAVASTLHRVGFDVTVVDAAAGPGGRVSTWSGEPASFDHGAPSFTSRDPRFARQIHLWETAGVITRWTGRQGRWSEGAWRDDPPRSARWVARPKMGALVEHVLRDAPLRTDTRVTALERVANGIAAHTERGRLGVWDRVVLTIPGPPAAALLAPVSPALAAQGTRIEVAPCWVVMAVGDAGLPYDAARLDGPVRWIERQDTRPGRGGPERWVLHASADWSRQHERDDAGDVARALCSSLHEATGRSIDAVGTQLWRHARVERPLGVDFAADAELILAGDGCLGGRVEAAWLSGVAAAGHLLRELADLRPRDPR